jgi:hypothetical protein
VNIVSDRDLNLLGEFRIKVLQLGLTTQLSWLFQIGCKYPRRRIKRGRCTIAFIKQNNDITEGNIPLLQILDAIRYINRIPETSERDILIRLAAILQQLSESQIEEIIFLSNKYSAATKRVLRSLLMGGKLV